MYKGTLRSNLFLYQEMPKMAKKLPYNLHGGDFQYLRKKKKVYQYLTTISSQKFGHR